MIAHPAGSFIELALLPLQFFQVLFLAVHDWIPLGRLNDVQAVRRADSTPRLAMVTAIQTVPFLVALIASLQHLGRPYPVWLFKLLWISYGILLLGQLRAWWIPYLLHPEPARAARYQVLFGNTHTFLPSRNGLVPNTAHLLLHLATAATLLLLLIS